MTHQDQTHFSNTEPLFEDPSLPQPPTKPATLEEIEAEKKRKKRSYMIAAISGIGLLLVISMVFILMLQPAPSSQTQEPEPSIQPTAVQPTQQQRELNALKTRLTEIDPTKDYLLLPPVNYALSLEE